MQGVIKMSGKQFLKTLLPSLLLMGSISLFGAAVGDSMLDNGDFQKDADKNSVPDGWNAPGKGISYPAENGNVYLKIDGGKLNNGKSIKLDPDWRAFKLTGKARYDKVVQGKETWETARIAMEFKDKDGKHVDPWPWVFGVTGSSNGQWVNIDHEYIIPPGAVSLSFSPANFGTAGTVEFDDLKLTVTAIFYKGDVPAPEELVSFNEHWSLKNTWRQKNRTRDSISLNGLWKFIPQLETSTTIPAPNSGWGYFKVPGTWPEFQKNNASFAQEIVYAPETIDRISGKTYEQAWYKRDIDVPSDWKDKKIFIDFGMIQTHAKVFIDGADAGELWFPGGKLDITKNALPGKKQTIVVLLTARPLEAESKVFMAPDRIITKKAELKMKGLTGDVYLVAEPSETKVDDVLAVTSVGKGRVDFETTITDLPSGQSFRLNAVIYDGETAVKAIRSSFFKASELKNSKMSFGDFWPEAKKWDTDTPSNIYRAVISLEDSNGRILDETLPITFGFREFQIVGKDFFLNGKKIHLRALLLDNLCMQAERASLEGSLNSCKKLKDNGFNFFITGNYGFEPGQVGYMDALFEAADKTGMLCSFSLPHEKDFNWLKTKENIDNYRAMSRWLIRRVQNHPAIIMYAMTHNATGYHGDQNPLKMDGVYDPVVAAGETTKNPSEGSFVFKRVQAELAADIARDIDRTRAVYHHQCGNLGQIYTLNCYLNWAPRQERSEWMRNWSQNGVKPFFFVEWGLPHIASWSSYRGPQFIWRYEAFQQVWDSEFAASILGDKTYKMDEMKLALMAEEEKAWATGKPFFFSRFTRYISQLETNYREVKEYFSQDNWRSHRAWGVSAMLPWDQEGFWLRNSTPAKISAYADRYRNLKKPGIVPDFIPVSNQSIYDLSEKPLYDFTSIGREFMKWNKPFIAFIGGGKEFTDKAHNFEPGEKVSKQLLVLNDSRSEGEFSYKYSIDGSTKSGKLSIRAGESSSVKIEFEMPSKSSVLSAEVKFPDGTVFKDEFTLDPVKTPSGKSFFASMGLSSYDFPKPEQISVFDPKGLTIPLLDAANIEYTKLDSIAKIPESGILIIGREAFSDKNMQIDFSSVPNGLRVLIMEQSPETLAGRFGFRMNIQGIRNVFIRDAKHPVFAGLSQENLRDWRGASTLTSPSLVVDPYEQHDPRWNWLGFENTRVWRNGNNGNICSVLIEKPEKGNFLSLLDCGFDLQYSPLIEYSEGRGKVVFCQLDLSGRTEVDPVAKVLIYKLINYLNKAAAAPERKVFYYGDGNGEKLLKDLSLDFLPVAGGKQDSSSVLVVSGSNLNLGDISDTVKDGMNVLCLALDQNSADNILPGLVKIEKMKVPSSMAERNNEAVFRGLSNADFHRRTLMDFNGIKDSDDPSIKVVKLGRGTVVFCQVAPWQLDYAKKPYLRSSYRRSTFMVSRILANMGASFDSSLLKNISRQELVITAKLPSAWKGEADKSNKGRDQKFFDPSFNDASWRPIKVPGLFDVERKDLSGYDGLFWYRLKFRVPEELKNNDRLLLNLGAVDDESWVWMNGEFLGEVTKATNPQDYYSVQRKYVVGRDIMDMGGAENTLVVLVNDTYLNGGIKGVPSISIVDTPWDNSYYVQKPVADDDPYRYYRW